MKYCQTTTHFNCGIDLHARQMYVCVVDRQGKKLLHQNIRHNDFRFFLTKIARWKHDLTVVCECLLFWYCLADARLRDKTRSISPLPRTGAGRSAG